jgi:hypothetical protein
MLEVEDLSATTQRPVLAFLMKDRLLGWTPLICSLQRAVRSNTGNTDLGRHANHDETLYELSIVPALWSQAHAGCYSQAATTATRLRLISLKPLFDELKVTLLAIHSLPRRNLSVSPVMCGQRLSLHSCESEQSYGSSSPATNAIVPVLISRVAPSASFTSHGRE